MNPVINLFYEVDLNLIKFDLEQKLNLYLFVNKGSSNFRYYRTTCQYESSDQKYTCYGGSIDLKLHKDMQLMFPLL
jgi:hypothetical protein